MQQLELKPKEVVSIRKDDLPNSPVSGAFGDNGGDPDGWGSLLAPAECFSRDELDELVAAGGKVVDGYVLLVPQDCDLRLEELKHKLKLPSESVCFYVSSGLLVTVSPVIAREIAQFIAAHNAAAQAEDEEE